MVRPKYLLRHWKKKKKIISSSFQSIVECLLHSLLQSESVFITASNILFVIIAQELSHLDLSKTNTLTFFFAMILLGFCLQLIWFDALVWNFAVRLNLSKKWRHILACVLSFVLFLTGLPTTTYGGLYVIILLSDYIDKGNIVFTVLLRTAAILVYGEAIS